MNEEISNKESEFFEIKEMIRLRVITIIQAILCLRYTDSKIIK